MAKRQNFVVGSTNPNTETLTQAQLNNGWDKYEVLKSGVLDGTFNAVSDYSNDSSNEIANAIASITGSQPTGQSQSELAGALNQMRQDIETSSLTFKGYVSDTAPSSSTYSLIEGDIWIDSATLPTSFPVAIAGVWDGTQWASTTDTYTVKNFDFFRNINDNEGYYWFGGEWVVMSTDMSTTYFSLNQTSGKWEIKSSVNLPGQPTAATPTALSSANQIATKGYVDGIVINVGADLFDFKWKDYTLTNSAWKLSDNGDWIDGNVYEEAYNHLVDDIDGKTSETETIGLTTIAFYRADDGHKICTADQETNWNSMYSDAGISWYYVLDTANKRFKLPRTKFEFTGYRTGVGNYVKQGLPNITGYCGAGAYTQQASGAFATASTPSATDFGGQYAQVTGVFDFDASRSNSIYGATSHVQPPATEMKLYFYVGIPSI